MLVGELGRLCIKQEILKKLGLDINRVDDSDNIRKIGTLISILNKARKTGKALARLMPKEAHNSTPQGSTKLGSSSQLEQEDLKILQQASPDDFENYLCLILSKHLPGRLPYSHKDKKPPSRERETSMPQGTIRRDGRVPPKKADF